MNTHKGPYCNRPNYTPSTKRTYGLPLTPEETEIYKVISGRNNRASKARRNATPEGRAHNLCYDARQRAQHEGVPFTITEQWVLDKLKAGRCERTGIEFDLSKSKTSRVNKYAPSLDRRSTRLGYTPDNTRVVVWLYNVAKSDFSDSDLLDFSFLLLRKRLQETN